MQKASISAGDPILRLDDPTSIKSMVLGIFNKLITLVISLLKFKGYIFLRISNEGFLYLPYRFFNNTLVHSLWYILTTIRCGFFIGVYSKG